MDETKLSTIGHYLNSPSQKRHQRPSYWGKSLWCVYCSILAPCIPRTGQENHGLAAYRSALT
eukprot:2092414-Amphidinium_carterae.2